jgi:hypothetical protein
MAFRWSIPKLKDPTVEPEWKRKLIKTRSRCAASVRLWFLERLILMAGCRCSSGDPAGWVPTCMQCHGGRLPGSGRYRPPNTEMTWLRLPRISQRASVQPDQSRRGQTRGADPAAFQHRAASTRNEDLLKRASPVDNHKNSIRCHPGGTSRRPAVWTAALGAPCQTLM